jgi:hypothetical protein
LPREQRGHILLLGKEGVTFLTSLHTILRLLPFGWLVACLHFKLKLILVFRRRRELDELGNTGKKLSGDD